uniref:Uncharacterized protein n=1 Tax=Romanomermis culicivorax TaxID=13658 RepID=A0A915KXD7_ROMCU
MPATSGINDYRYHTVEGITIKEGSSHQQPNGPIRPLAVTPRNDQPPWARCTTLTTNHSKEEDALFGRTALLPKMITLKKQSLCC